MDRLLFAAAACVLSFLYGVATVQLEVFPYRLLKEARLGWEAWASLEKERFPKAFQRFEADAAPRPGARHLAQGAGAEAVLVTGGPYQMMDLCPTHGCMAWISDREGRILHTWEVDLDQLREGLAGISGRINRLSLNPVGMSLGADGSLLITLQGRDTYPIYVSLVKVDRRGRIVWKRVDHSHHWPAVDAQGRIYAPYSILVKNLKQVAGTVVPVSCRTGVTSVDAIRVVSPEGESLREIALLEGFVRSGHGALFYAVRDGCDITHLNSVALLPPSAVKAIPGASAGDLLVSLREPSAVALLDAHSGAVKYVLAGRTGAQHSAQFLPDGTVLAFDNLGGDAALGGSRVVRLDLVKGSAATVFPRGGEEGLLPVRSETAGHINVSEDGTRALVSVTHQGRIIEIDVASGTPLWVYENTQDFGRFLAANDIGSPTTRTRFAVYGAYYVRNTDFLKEQ
jgi:hypothetical protein